MNFTSKAAAYLSILAVPAMGLITGCAVQEPSGTDDATTVDTVDQALTTTHLASTECGTWDNKGVHTKGVYFVGHSKEHPAETLSYFVFDLTPIKGKTVTAASLSIPGTTDWGITVPWTNHTPLFQIKVGPTPLPAALTLAHVTGGSNDSTLYNTVHREQDLGYGWTPGGNTLLTFDSFHYNPARFQTSVNAGGRTAIFAVSRFGETATTEEYIFGGGVCSSKITLNVTTQ